MDFKKMKIFLYIFGSFLALLVGLFCYMNYWWRHSESNANKEYSEKEKKIIEDWRKNENY